MPAKSDLKDERQSPYIIEDTGSYKQIARFAADGNRIAVITVESADEMDELLFIKTVLNKFAKHHRTIEPTGPTVT